MRQRREIIRKALHLCYLPIHEAQMGQVLAQKEQGFCRVQNSFW